MEIFIVYGNCINIDIHNNNNVNGYCDRKAAVSAKIRQNKYKDNSASYIADNKVRPFAFFVCRANKRCEAGKAWQLKKPKAYKAVVFPFAG